MKLLGYVLIWLAIVAGFTGVGFLNREGHFPSPYAIEPIVAFAAIGVGSGSYIVAGLIVINKLRARCFGKGAATGLLVAFAVASIIIPLLIVSAVARATRGGASGNHLDLFGGEHAMWAFAIVSHSFWCALTALIAFLIFALGMSKPKHEGSGSTT